MNVPAMDELAREARAFSRAYVEVKESLMRAGVVEMEAKDTARSAAVMAALMPEDEWRAR